MTTIQVTGTSHPIHVSPEQYEQHKEFIIMAANGEQLESKVGVDNWAMCSSYEFGPKNEYRAKVRMPKAGEVWYCDGISEGLLILDNLSFVCIEENHDYGKTFDGAERYASSLSQYYAKQFIAKANEHCRLNSQFTPEDSLQLVVEAEAQ